MAHLVQKTFYIFALGWIALGCGSSGDSERAGKPGTQGCESVTGSPWVPQISADSSAPPSTLMSDVFSTRTDVIGYSDPVLDSTFTTFQIPMEEDLGENGSLTLVAEVTDFPAGVRGVGVPLLVSLTDGERDWIALNKAGAPGGCGDEGLFTCTPFGCSISSECDLNETSAYASLSQWLQHQVNPFAAISMNVFPTCNWNSGEPGCAFNTDFFVAGSRLRHGPGVTYTAKYLVLSDGSKNVAPGNQANVRLEVIRKKASDPVDTIRFNIFLVGTKNIRASRTTKGKANLDALVGYLDRHYSQSARAIRIARVNVYEWTCEQGGDAFASAQISRLGDLFQTGSLLPNPTTPSSPRVADAVNLFLVSDILDSDIEGTMLGVAGGIPGSIINGTGASGVAIATFNRLDQFNRNCPSEGPCPLELHDEEFWTLGTTVSHETGHFLGLNHPSEGDGREHDALPDTPTCSETEVRRGIRLLTVNSCLRDRNDDGGRTCEQACGGYDGITNFCEEAKECQFNHLMWWTLKNYNSKTARGDGNLLSDNSLSVLRYHALIR